jgi:F0F1-type ATP synthase alpha subunit
MKLSKENAVIGIMGHSSQIAIGDEVVFEADNLLCEVGPALVGRVISPSGAVRDGGGPIGPGTSPALLFSKPPSMQDREHALHQSKRIFTGIASLDFFYPMAVGQRTALVGPKFVVFPSSFTKIYGIFTVFYYLLFLLLFI